MGALMTISLSRESINLMMQSQKMIKKEFGVRIDLDDEQLMARVFAYASQSNSGDLIQCANKLMQLLLPSKSEDSSNPSEQKQVSTKRIYRGQVLPEIITDVSSQNQDAQIKTKKNVIYRGQRVA